MPSPKQEAPLLAPHLVEQRQGLALLLEQVAALPLVQARAAVPPLLQEAARHLRSSGPAGTSPSTKTSATS